MAPLRDRALDAGPRRREAAGMITAFPLAWAMFTLAATLAQTYRNAAQRGLTGPLGATGATFVRFLFGLPFAILFLAIASVGHARLPPAPDGSVFGWAALGALEQILATALMLSAMRGGSFVTTIAYTKTEPVQVALFGLAFLGERLTVGLALAILVATAGVMLMSWPTPAQRAERAAFKPAALGLASGAFFALSAIGFRGAIVGLDDPSFVLRATTVLALGLAIQTGLIGLWLAAVDRRRLGEILKMWRPSMKAGFAGALASQFWFLAFALASAAAVRTLALVEVIWAQIASKKLFQQGASAREKVGVGLIVAGVMLLLNQ
jgi:drug/metabolite transporter (DMT)-like permease